MKHEIKKLTVKEVEQNRSNAYDYLELDKIIDNLKNESLGDKLKSWD